jgi:hypothetical protein
MLWAENDSLLSKHPKTLQYGTYRYIEYQRYKISPSYQGILEQKCQRACRNLSMELADTKTGNYRSSNKQTHSI